MLPADELTWPTQEASRTTPEKSNPTVWTVLRKGPNPCTGTKKVGASHTTPISSPPGGSCPRTAPFVLGANSTRHVGGACGANGAAPSAATRDEVMEPPL